MKIKPMTRFLKAVLGSNIVGITLAPFGIYLKETHLHRPKTINHEKIHWRQQLEMLIIFFYLWYIVEWMIRLFTNPGDAYKNLSFEREAYANDRDSEYLKTRKFWAWFRYIKKS